MTSENTKKRSRLFSRLLVEEYNRLAKVVNSHIHETSGKNAWKAANKLAEYFLFLKAQRNTRNPWCPYGMAVKQIVNG